MTGIVELSLVPLRTNNSEKSEMCSQLLFGERVEILEVQEKWLRVRNYADNYEGWIDRKMIRLLSEEEKDKLLTADLKYIQLPLSECGNDVSEKTLLPGGSVIPFFNGKEYQFTEKLVHLNHADVVAENANEERIISLAKQYLNAPYLWGGKTILGIDCSGLVQVVFRMCNIQLPRDASQQVQCGKTVDFLSEVRTGDLAFFENAEGSIIHVGILLNSHQIIHASGCVKIETIDSQGIISSQTGEYTHTLRIIKRMIN